MKTKLTKAKHVIKIKQNKQNSKNPKFGFLGTNMCAQTCSKGYKMWYLQRLQFNFCLRPINASSHFEDILTLDIKLNYTHQRRIRGKTI